MKPWLVAPFLAAAVSTCLAVEPHSGKKLIEWGWDEPDTQFIRQNIEAMEACPFDGLVFHVVSSKGGNLAWEMWGSRKFTVDEFRHAIENLKATKFRRFTERFLRVNVTPGDVDWFDDEAWDVVLANAAVAAEVAGQGGCRGFMFDVEQYDQSPFDYAKQKRRASESFEAYRAVVRRRGRQWMEAVNGRFPDVTILLTFGYRLAQPPQGKSRAETRYGLLADFLDGMLDGCSRETKIVDAWEYSYPYTRPSQFDEARTTIREKALAWTAVPDVYRRHVQAGFGLWMDCRWREQGWNLDDFSKNYFTPQAFRESVEAALNAADKYVWIYTEQPRWWTGERLPAEYVAAVREARSAVTDFHAVRCEGTYPHHLQGVATSDRDAIYWSFTTTLVKTDTLGKVLKQVPVANHHGDLCYAGGRLYVAVNLGKFNDPAGNADSWVYVYDPADLSLLEKHATGEVFHGAGGIAVRDGHFFVVGGLPPGIDENFVYEYDDQFAFVKKHVIRSGNTLMGIQTAAFADGAWWFGCYGDPKTLLKTDPSFRLVGKYEQDASLGIVGLPDGRLLIAAGRCQAQIGCSGSLLVARPNAEKGFVVEEKPD